MVGHDGQRVRVETNFHTFPDARYARHEIFIIVKTKAGMRIYDQIHDKEGSIRGQLQREISSGYAF